MIEATSDAHGHRGDSEAVLRQLHDALTHLRDLPILGTHPLGSLIGQPTPLALRQILLDAIEALRPPSHVAASAPRWRHYRYLRLRYVEGAPLPQVGAALGIGERQARREHRAALQELAAILLDRSWQSVGKPATALPGAAPRSPSETFWDEALSVASGSADLDAELKQIEAEPSLEPIELRPALADASRLIAQLAAAHAVDIQLLPGDAPSAVLATRSILRQILLNVLSYLIDLPSARRIQVTTLAADANAEIRFVAEGAELGDRATSSPALVAAKRLAQNEQGSLLVEQTPEGVIARLFLLTNQATLVLVVDDNPDLIRLFRRYLHGEGFRLLQARNAIRAQQLARTLRPDVIVLDLMMPVQDGWDFFQAMRNEPATAEIPVVACSVLPERELALSLQASDFLAKPVTPETLRNALAPYRRTFRPDPDLFDPAAARRDSP